MLKQEVTDWSELGGPAGKIDVFVRVGTISGVGYSTRTMIFGDAGAAFGSDVVEYKSSGPLEQQVEMNPTSIAITGVSSARLRKVKIMSVDGVEASQTNIGSGEYPYFRPLYLVYKESISDGRKQFLQFVLSKKGQAIVHEQGTVNLEDGWKLVKKFGAFGDTAIIDNYQALVATADERLKK